MQKRVIMCLAVALLYGCGESPPVPPASAKSENSATPIGNDAANPQSTTIAPPAVIASERTDIPAAGERLALEFLPRDAFAAIVFNARRAFQSRALSPLPFDELLGTSIEAWSFDPRDVENWLLFATPPVANEPLGTPYSPGAVVRFTRPVDGPALLARRGIPLTETEFNGKRYHAQTTQPATAFYLPNDRTIVFAAEEQLKKMLSPAQGISRLGEQLPPAELNFDIHIVMDVESLTPALDGLSRFAEQQLPASVLPYVKALGDVSMVTLTIDLSGEHLASGVIAARDAQAAERLHKLARESQPMIHLAYSMLRGQIVRAWTHEASQSVLDVTDPILRRASVAYEPDSIRVEVPKPASLDEFGGRLRMAMERNTAQK
jgi:hypothetical protein